MADTNTLKTISFNLRTDKTIVNTTVKIVVAVSALVGSDLSDAALRTDVRTNLVNFIDTDWEFSNLSPRREAGVYEKVSLTATARVPETEAFNLEVRASMAGNDNISFRLIDADAAIPESMITAAESDLRLDLLAKADAELAKINEVTTASYDLLSIQFGRIEDASQPRLRAPNAPSYALECASSAYDDGEEGLGNAQRFSLSANVTLAGKLR